MKEKKIIRKMQISYDGQHYRDLSFICANLVVFDYPHSELWEIHVKLKSELPEGKMVDVMFVTEDNQRYKAKAFIFVENINNRVYVLQKRSELLRF
ncbi:hypothetical protein DER53_03100 [Parageobacillus toebii NBRC 107807]|uniref:Uncharacterized protein n=1 Tax=Parageobacillus toebii NBRC 107807 TaxID=1223503 RepID=A0A6G9IZT3_9BACL|nr:hypothetical protein [Parageobacillus toebii]MBB3870178.1 hypothetical protein [Parageobacillus toebii NBRC 107807]MED4968226.1 hypothetical protein [Parageobacillus toebii]QIQ31968.1 hypothetical protein DER53_03100 [Parageobacillus toebii NBRC 107807]